jgi:predicted enzyme related to lactoylglutathione lyase
VHTLVYSDDADATRAFFRDVLGWPFAVDERTDSGWLIFKTGPSEMGVHPTSGTYEGQTYSSPRHHAISLMCDDVAATVEELTAKGVTFSGEIQDFGWGLGTMMQVPAADDIMLYEARHPTAYDR